MERTTTKAIIVCSLALLTCMAAWMAKIDQAVAVSAAVDLAPVIILDAGHGGQDGGAVGVGGIIEKDLNLTIALKLNDMLEAAGYRVIMTRDEDVSIHDNSAKTVRDRKVSDIKNRLKLLETTPNAILVSIHQNIFGGKAIGTQVFYGPNDPESAKLASVLQADFKSMLQPENNRETKRATDDIYILYHATNPAVMVECGFISNNAEAELLCDDEYQNQVCFVMLSAIGEYLSVG